MKKHLLLLALPMFLLVFASCGGPEEKTYKLEVDSDNLTFIAEGAAARTVNVTAENVEWSVELNDAATTWLRLEQKEASVSVTVDDNPETTERTAKFTVKSNATGVDSKEITVIQAGVPVSLDVDPSELPFEVAGGTRIVTVTSNVEWDAEITEGGGEWITAEKGEEGISITVAANGTADLREAQLTVSADGAEDVVVTITQEGLPAITNTFTTAAGSFWGDSYNNGHGNYFIELLSTPLNERGKIGGEGIYITIDCVSDFPADITLPVIDFPAGTYTVAGSPRETNANYTVYTQYSMVKFYDTEAHALEFWDEGLGKYKQELDYISGTFTVSRDGENTVIDFEILLETDVELKDSSVDYTYAGLLVEHIGNSLIVKGSFNGPLNIANRKANQ